MTELTDEQINAIRQPYLKRGKPGHLAFARALIAADRAAQQERNPHTEAEVQEILAADWSLSQDNLENRVRKILGVPAP